MCVWLFSLNVCLCANAYGGQKWLLDPLELGVADTVSYHVGPGN